MQQRHVEAISQTLQDFGRDLDLTHPAQRATFSALCLAFADMCAWDYKGAYGFDRARFLAACKPRRAVRQDLQEESV